MMPITKYMNIRLNSLEHTLKKYKRDRKIVSEALRFLKNQTQTFLNGEAIILKSDTGHSDFCTVKSSKKSTSFLVHNSYF